MASNFKRCRVKTYKGWFLNRPIEVGNGAFAAIFCNLLSSSISMDLLAFLMKGFNVFSNHSSVGFLAFLV